MKGVVFNLLEEFVTQQWGLDAYERILDKCPFKHGGVFVGPETYPDAELLTLVTVACAELGVPADDALRAFGRFMFPRLAAKFPLFVRDHTHPRTFLKTIHDVIHVEVRKLMRDAEPPTIHWAEVDDDELVLTYESSRGLCALMEGLLAGTADFFGTHMTFSHTQCARRGAGRCEFRVSFAASVGMAS